jgi:hypothetical protein
MRRIPLPLVLAAVVATVVMAAACGSSSKSSTPSSVTTTTTAHSATAFPKSRQAYLSAGNAICKAMNTQMEDLPDPGSSATKEAAVLVQSATIINDALRSLRKLPVPPGDQATVAAIFAKVDVVAADTKKLAATLKTNDQAAGQRAQAKLQQDSQTANAASNAYGLTVCGS